VDGIGNVIALLEEIENGKLGEVEYIEALSCPAGCVGGPLTAVNPHVARARVEERARTQGWREAEAVGSGGPEPAAAGASLDLGFSRAIEPMPALVLDRDIGKAMAMMEELEAMAALLPGLDCGSCGAPNCQALAEDIARGTAVETDCIFRLREKVRVLAGKLLALEEMQPPGLDKE
jgi:hypothetical protein